MERQEATRVDCPTKSDPFLYKKQKKTIDSKQLAACSSSRQKEPAALCHLQSTRHDNFWIFGHEIQIGNFRRVTLVIVVGIV